MEIEMVSPDDLRQLYLPPKSSHKGENGKLTIIGGSALFHGASLWALKVASRIVDMVFYASIPENNDLTNRLKTEIFDFIAVPRGEIENYIEESEAILIGPGMVREKEWKTPESGIIDWNNTREVTEYLLKKYLKKKWVIDAGSLQMMDKKWLNQNCLITPHRKEFSSLFGDNLEDKNEEETIKYLKNIVEQYRCTILLKGTSDIICGLEGVRVSRGGNPGMTKGGTGDVLAGLTAALACKNDLFLAACSASYINKQAGDELAKNVGYFFNASDLCDQIQRTMKSLLVL